jgi:hypothetical protein
MKYIANPVEADAFVILFVHLPNSDGGVPLTLDKDGSKEMVLATKEMCARMKPFPGDYWVIQSDGYVYLNPKDVFEKKYSPQSTEVQAMPAEKSES